MGLIKTAIISGAAVYGVNQLAKTAQNRQSQPQAPSPPRRDYSDREYRDDYDYNGSRCRPLEFRERTTSRDQPRYVEHGGQYDGQQPRQRLYLEDQRQGGRQPYYMQEYDDLVSYEERPSYDERGYGYASASETRSGSAPPPLYFARQNRQGFVEPEGFADDQRGQGQISGGGGRGEMLQSLAQQAMGMGLVGGGKKGKKGKDGKSNLLSNLLK